MAQQLAEAEAPGQGGAREQAAQGVQAEQQRAAEQQGGEQATAEQAQARKASVQTQVDKVVSWFVPAVLVIALITLTAWLLLGGGSAWACSVRRRC